MKDGTVVMGRSKGDVCRSRSENFAFSRCAAFRSAYSKLSFTDLKSLNGTLLNGDISESGELHDGDQLQLGNTLFDCQIGSSEETLASTPARKPPKKKEREARPGEPSVDDSQHFELDAAPEREKSQRREKNRIERKNALSQKSKGSTRTAPTMRFRQRNDNPSLTPFLYSKRFFLSFHGPFVLADSRPFFSFLPFGLWYPRVN